MLEGTTIHLEALPMFPNENEKKFNSLVCKFDRSEIYLIQIFKRLGTGLLYNWLVFVSILFFFFFFFKKKKE